MRQVRPAVLATRRAGVAHAWPFDPASWAAVREAAEGTPAVGVAGEQGEVAGRAIVVDMGVEGDLRAEDRRTPDARAGVAVLDRAVEAVPVGQGEGGLAQVGGAAREGVGRTGPIQE
ncbi:MAG: hypothetical protein U0232_31830 [Thermomicrobiales bacterium]